MTHEADFAYTPEQEEFIISKYLWVERLVELDEKYIKKAIGIVNRTLKDTLGRLDFGKIEDLLRGEQSKIYLIAVPVSSHVLYPDVFARLPQLGAVNVPYYLGVYFGEPEGLDYVLEYAGAKDYEENRERLRYTGEIKAVPGTCEARKQNAHLN